MSFRSLYLCAFFQLMTLISLSQPFVYKFTDPCTLKLKEIVLDNPAGNAVLMYNGQLKSFSQSQLTSGALEQWINDINSMNPSGPCSGIGLYQNTSINALVAQNNILVMSSVMSALSDINSMGGSNLTGIVEAKEKTSSNNKKKSNNPTPESSQSNNSINQNNTTVVGNQTTNNTNSTDNTNSNSQNQANNTTVNSNNQQQINNINTPNNNIKNTSGNNSNNQQQVNGVNGLNSNKNSNSTISTNTTSQNKESINTTNTPQTGNTSSRLGVNSSNTKQSETNSSSQEKTNGITNNNVNGTKNSTTTNITQNEENGSSTTQSEENGSTTTQVGTTQSITSVNKSNNKNNAEANSNSTVTKNENLTNTSNNGLMNIGSVKEKVSNAKQGGVLLTGDLVVISSASSSQQFRLNMSITKANTKNTFVKGALLNFTSAINNSNLTLFAAYRIKKFTGIVANSSMLNFEKDFFNTTSLMGSYKYKMLTTTLGLNYTFGNLGDSKFKSISCLGGAVGNFKITKKINNTTMLVAIYSPYVFYYEGLWYQSGWLVVPFTAFDYKLSKKFKLNLSFSGVKQINAETINYQVLIGAKALL